MRARFNFNKMEDFFGQFRQLASSLDRNCNELRSTLDNPDDTSLDENRSCLMLQQILGEVQSLKSDVKNEIKEGQKKFHSAVLPASIRLTQCIGEHITNLESHLQKYGYVKLQGDLPEPHQLVNSSEAAHEKESGSAAMELEENETQLHANSSDDGYVDDIHMSDEKENTPPHDYCDQEKAETVVDPLKSPVQPVTFTQMIEVTPVKEVHLSLEGQHIPKCETPEPPPTTTPMFRGRSKVNCPESPEDRASSLSSRWVLPCQPVTATPIIKVRPEAETIEGPLFESPAATLPQLPQAPVMDTPGLQRYTNASRPDCTEDCAEFSQFSFMDEIPMAPEITSVKILQPDEVSVSNLTETQPPCKSIVLLNEDEYLSLPDYVKNQFSCEVLNNLILKINIFLSTRATENSQPGMNEQELRDELQLGPRTKALMLALARLERLAISGDRMIFQKRN